MSDWESTRINIYGNRDCVVADHRVVIPPPIFMGRGYVFDGHLNMDSVRMKCLGIPLSTEEIPFQDIRSVTIESEYHEGFHYSGGGFSPGGYMAARTSYRVVMIVRGRRTNDVVDSGNGPKENGDKILAAILQVTRVR